MSHKAKQELVSCYKSIPREVLGKCPSGTRAKIAKLIGKDKSFVSQITSPNCRTPLPEKYVEPVLDEIRPGPHERELFMTFYGRAHPKSRAAGSEADAVEDARLLQIALPRLGSRWVECEIDLLITKIATMLNDMGESVDPERVLGELAPLKGRAPARPRVASPPPPRASAAPAGRAGCGGR